MIYKFWPYCTTDIIFPSRPTWLYSRIPSPFAGPPGVHRGTSIRRNTQSSWLVDQDPIPRRSSWFTANQERSSVATQVCPVWQAEQSGLRFRHQRRWQNVKAVLYIVSDFWHTDPTCKFHPVWKARAKICVFCFLKLNDILLVKVLKLDNSLSALGPSLSLLIIPA